MKNEGLKVEISHFSRAFEGNMSKWSVIGWETLNYIFLTKKFPLVIERGISHFSRAFEGNMSKWSLNGWGTHNYIFYDQKFPSVERI